MLRGRSVAIDICRGLEYLHAREILHFGRDYVHSGTLQYANI